MYTMEQMYQEQLALKQLLGSRFTLEERIGGGSFGKIYKGKDKESGEWVAIKAERKLMNPPTLEREVGVLEAVADGFGFPKLIYSAKDDSRQIIVMTYLGSDLEKLFKQCNRRFTLKTVVMLADQMLNRLEFLHSKGYLHRDIKPENWVMGMGKTGRNLHLIDFGLTKPWREPDGSHMPYKADRGIVGTARYASVNVHNGLEPTRRDDLESMGYLLVYFYKGKLPWQRLGKQSLFNRTDKFSTIADVKKKTSVSELCKDCPKIFSDFMKYVRGLSYEDAPDYRYLKKLFRTYAMEKGYDFDYVYDWISNSKMIEDGRGGNKKDNKTPNKKNERKPKRSPVNEGSGRINSPSPAPTPSPPPRTGVPSAQQGNNRSPDQAPPNSTKGLADKDADEILLEISNKKHPVQDVRLNDPRNPNSASHIIMPIQSEFNPFTRDLDIPNMNVGQVGWIHTTKDDDIHRQGLHEPPQIRVLEPVLGPRSMTPPELEFEESFTSSKQMNLHSRDGFDERYYLTNQNNVSPVANPIPNTCENKAMPNLMSPRTVSNNSQQMKIDQNAGSNKTGDDSKAYVEYTAENTFFAELQKLASTQIVVGMKRFV